MNFGGASGAVVVIGQPKKSYILLRGRVAMRGSHTPTDLGTGVLAAVRIAKRQPYHSEAIGTITLDSRNEAGIPRGFSSSTFGEKRVQLLAAVALLH